MDEELQKRNTDCVYFLASPLTCKKGIECEYRHSEIARLNPRDCWYWLAGSCLNLSCPFRHPPLDGHPEKSPQSAPQYDHTSVPVNKTDVPCFFFFNGFCNKGDKCTFLHGPDDATHPHAWKSSKAASTTSNPILLEKKISTGSDTGSTHIDANPNPSKTVVPIKTADDSSTPDKAKQEFQQLLTPNNIEERSDSPQMMSASEGDDEAEGFIQGSSDENFNGDHIEREDWLESSPGFDVLVNDRLENLGYEDDPEYLLDQSTVYEDPVEYNPQYQEGRILYEQGITSFGDLDNELTFDYIRKNPIRSRERMLNPLPGRKRKFLSTDTGRRGVDLRDHLKKRRVFDGPFETCFSRKHGLTRVIGRSRERPQGPGRFGSRLENETLFKGKPRRPRLNKSRPQVKERRQGKQFPSSEVLRKPVSKKRKTNEEPSVFTGPKTLHQIKEEKKRAEQNGDSFGKTRNSGRSGSEDFQGPKPLSEILKDKRRPGLVTDGYNDSS
ncbi:hypothetical protein LguiB_011600 [Lonicera macranthoides]